MNNNIAEKYLIIWPILFFVIGMYCLPLSFIGFDFSYIPGDLGDSRLNNYFLEHGYKWLTGIEDNFWDAPFFYPVKNVMAFSDNHLGTLPLYTIFRLLKFDPQTSFQFWIITLFCFNYASCFYILKKFSFSFFSASAGAFIYAFSLPVVARFGHPQLLPRFLVPFGFYFAYHYFKKGDSLILVGLCISIVWQFYCTIYIGLFSIFLISFLFIAMLLIDRKEILLKNIFFDSKKKCIVKLSIIFISIGLLLTLFMPYISVARKYGFRDWSTIVSMLPYWHSYLRPTESSLMWSWVHLKLKTIPMSWEHQIFVGVFPWIAFLAASFICFFNKNIKIRKVGLVSLLSFLFFIIATFNIGGFSIYKLFTILPGIGAIRAVTRMILVLLFTFAIFISIFFSWLEFGLKKYHPMIKYSIMVILVFLLSLDQSVKPFPRFNKEDSNKRVEKIVTAITNSDIKSDLFVYMPEKKDPPYSVHLDAMLAAQYLNIKTINGYSGMFPYYYSLFHDYDNILYLYTWIQFWQKNILIGDTKNYHEFKDLIVIRSVDVDSDHLQIKRFDFSNNENNSDIMKLIAIKSSTGKYISLKKDENDILYVRDNFVGDFEKFKLLFVNDNQIALVGSNDNFVCAEKGGNEALVANRKNIGPWEIFILVRGEKKDEVAFRAINGKYVTIENNKLFAKEDIFGESEAFRLIDLNN